MMKKSFKKMMGILAAGAFLTGGAAMLWQATPTASAKDKDVKVERRADDVRCYRGQRFGHHPRHGGPQHERISPRAASERMGKAFGLNAAEILDAQNDGCSRRDLFHGALVAKTSGRSFADVIKMKTNDNKWSDVEAKLGVKPEELRAVRLDMKASRLSEKLSIDKGVAKELIADHYRTPDIACASVVARLSGKDIKDVLSQKKINNSWRDVAKQNNVDKEKFHQAMQEFGDFGPMKHHGHRGHRGFPPPRP